MTIRRLLLPTLAISAFLALASIGQLTSKANAQAPATTAKVAIQATLQAGPSAAARTWRFELVNSAGTIVQTLSLGTSGAALSASEASQPLPFGSYTVRQILGNDTKTACDAASFYEVSAPVGAQAVVQLGAAGASVSFTIRPCGALPTNPQVVAPIDTVAPVAPTPIDEVRGDRTAGPAAPGAPNTGNAASGADGSSALALWLVLAGLAAAVTSPAGMAVALARQRSKR